MPGFVCFCVEVETGEPGQKRRGLRWKTSKISSWTQKSAPHDTNPDHINQEREAIALTTARRLISTLLTAWSSPTYFFSRAHRRWVFTSYRTSKYLTWAYLANVSRKTKVNKYRRYFIRVHNESFMAKKKPDRFQRRVPKWWN